MPRLQHALRVAENTRDGLFVYIIYPLIHLLKAGTAVGVTGGLDEAKHGGGVDVVVLIEEGASSVPLYPDPNLATLRRSDVFVCNESLEIINLKRVTRFVKCKSFVIN